MRGGTSPPWRATTSWDISTRARALDRKKPVGRMISSTSASVAVARSWTDTLTFAGGC
ncbi:MAG: hypothetical protein QOE72_4521 [Chloroflexota bacterium]|nr:hypothetical protein [Chloroflexota bacterium]